MRQTLAADRDHGQMPALKNRRRERFALEIAAMTPPGKAYTEAGFKASPWAPYNASKLMHDPVVAARIDEMRAAIGARAGIHAEYIQRQLLPIVEANAQDLFTTTPDATGAGTRDTLRSISKLPRELAAAIKKIKCDPETGAVTEIDLYGKIEAGALLLRSVGGLVDRLEATGKDGGPLEVARALSRHVVNSVAELLDTAERELGLPYGGRVSEDKRVTALVAKANQEGGALPPALYQVLHQKRNDSRDD
jgi:hypothetical protein